ncbi:superoxide dismutase [Mn], mitochondrial-like isoform X3 [Salvia splendens]|uniref:superoxide dismutase [Mn], mitochondrial-like isoform X3 n=1 Tax=Salvia splendens TaxID=180675 RepID=UPI001C269169|nr:superoxide dismutase [Mn], mitochondrial-like isoform X3 [Salvia splendens]
MDNKTGAMDKNWGGAIGPVRLIVDTLMVIRTLITRNPAAPLASRGLHTFSLPNLPYDYGDLEPAISAEIMQLHHQKHHQAYITNYNKALDQIQAAADAPTVVKLQSAIKFNGGGHVNHSIFWTNLAPVRAGGGEPPRGPLRWAIDNNFGSFEALIQKMSAEGAAVQGSGIHLLVKELVWSLCLVLMSGNMHTICSTRT